MAFDKKTEGSISTYSRFVQFSECLEWFCDPTGEHGLLITRFYNNFVLRLVKHRSLQNASEFLIILEFLCFGLRPSYSLDETGNIHNLKVSPD